MMHHTYNSAIVYAGEGSLLWDFTCVQGHRGGRKCTLIFHTRHKHAHATQNTIVHLC